MKPKYVLAPGQNRCSNLPNNKKFRHSIMRMSGIFFLMVAMVPAAYACIINFEEPIANPNSVVSQYCVQGI
jgi:hypothetical protein